MIKQIAKQIAELLEKQNPTICSDRHGIPFSIHPKTSPIDRNNTLQRAVLPHSRFKTHDPDESTFFADSYATITAMFHSLYHRTHNTLAPAVEINETGLDRTFLHWPANYLDGFREFDPDHFQLEVGGLVERPTTFSLKDLLGFTRIQQNRRLVFADGCAYRNTWEGFVVQELLHRVTPKAQANYLIQTDLAGHVECMPIKDLYAQRALFCLKVAGKPLPAIYGGPIRLLVFDRYAHKGLGQLVKIELSDTEVPGYFSGKGYEPSGQIEPSDYYATDLKTIQSIQTPGEVTQW